MNMFITFRTSAFIVLTAGVFWTPRAQAECPLQPGEEMLIFPTLASQVEGGTAWKGDVHGWIFKPERDSYIRTATLHRVMNSLGIPPLSDESDLFKKRMAYFLVDNERGRPLSFQVNRQLSFSGRSGPSGHFHGDVTAPDLAALSGGLPGPLPVRIQGCDDSPNAPAGELWPIPPQGISVISDLDDTVKISNVEDHRALVSNTFRHPYAAVEGMAALYTQWAKAGAVIHYVSASPWPLYPSLNDFLQTSGFPKGPLIMKHFRLKSRTFLSLFQDPVTYKLPLIRELLKRYPGREFILVGDSGEKDPEVYGQIAREFGPQVRLILIRNLHPQLESQVRYQNAFRSLPESQWDIFSKPDDVKDAWTRKASGLIVKDESSPRPPLELKAEDRILVLSPHPDDDILGCAGVIQSAVQKKLPVQVVYLTNGDNYEWAFLLYKKRPVLSSQGMLKMGAMRNQEASRAEGLLGVSPNQLIFLGYPDWGTEKIFSEYWGESRPPFRSMLTKVSAVPYAQAYRLGALYRGDSVLSDLEKIMKDFKPTKVFVSHPADGHRDHRAFYLFAQVALWDLADMIHPELYVYLVHYPRWPWPRGLSPDRKLEPPAPWLASRWTTLPLTPAVADLKLRALKEHRSQMVKDHTYLTSFVGTNELFEQVPDLRITSSTASTPALSTSTLTAATPEEKAEESEVAWRYVYRENEALVVRMELKSRLGPERAVRAYAFGYRRDRPFAEMPKLRIVIKKNRIDVFNQNQALVDADVQVSREGRTFELRIPLKTLGDPEKILGSVWSLSSEEPLDWRSWRVLDLGGVF